MAIEEKSLKKILDGILKTDMVVEEGTSGIWTYRKWSNGTAECWGTYTYTSSASYVWVSPLYYSDLIPRIAYPFTFAERPLEFASIDTTTNATWLYKESTGTNTTTQTAEYRPIKVNAFNSNTFYMRFYVIGKWATIDPSSSTLNITGFSQDQMSKREIQTLIEASGNIFVDNSTWVPSDLQ